MRQDEYDIGAAFSAIEEELIASMMRNMARHRAEETKEGIQWAMWPGTAAESSGTVQEREPETVQGKI